MKIQILFPDQTEKTVYFRNPTVSDLFPQNSKYKHYLIGYETIDPDTSLNSLKNLNIGRPVKLGVYIFVTYNQHKYTIYITNTTYTIKTIKDNIKKTANITLGTNQVLKLSGHYHLNYNDEATIKGSKIVIDPSLVASVVSVVNLPSPYIHKDLAMKAARV